MKLGFLYAGQGAQHPGMGGDLYETYPAFRQVFDQANLDFDLKQICFQGPEETLRQTEYTQPCLVAFAVGLTAVLREEGLVPSVTAGLSLGEYSALQAAGVFTPQTAISTAAFRGKAMAKAAQGIDCAMVAVLGLDRASVQSACAEASSLGVVEPCNYNCPGQIVVSGETAAVDRAVQLMKDRGARRCMPLKVSGPFHTSLLRPAAAALHDYFPTVTFQPPQIPVLFNCLGREMGEGDTIPDLLERQVCNSVYLEDCIRRMAELGVEQVIEIGPGKTLTGFVRKTLPSLPCTPIETVADVQKFCQNKKGAE